MLLGQAKLARSLHDQSGFAVCWKQKKLLSSERLCGFVLHGTALQRKPSHDYSPLGAPCASVGGTSPVSLPRIFRRRSHVHWADRARNCQVDPVVLLDWHYLVACRHLLDLSRDLPPERSENAHCLRAVSSEIRPKPRALSLGQYKARTKPIQGQNKTKTKPRHNQDKPYFSLLASFSYF